MESEVKCDNAEKRQESLSTILPSWIYKDSESCMKGNC